jgi:CHAT domain-containing protein
MNEFASTRLAQSIAVLIALTATILAYGLWRALRVPGPYVPELDRARWIEPRLTGARAWSPCRKTRSGNRAIDRANCGTAYLSPRDVSLDTKPCDQMTTTHATALQALITQPRCADAVIERLNELGAVSDARLSSDLAAAYYVRAQRDDRASDLLRSLQAAEKSTTLNATLPAAQFNLALVQDALGLSRKARVSWQTTGQLDHSRWADEARARQTAIERAEARAAGLQWPLNRDRLPEAVRAGDGAAIDQLIKPHPAATQRYVEEEVLAAWADATEEDRPDDARQILNEAMIIAAHLGQLTGDRYLSEVTARVAKARGRELRWLAAGHRAFARARAKDRAHDTTSAARAYEEALEELRRGGSPLRIGAELGHLVQLSFAARDELLEARLAELEEETAARGYHNVEARIQSNRGNFLQLDGKYLDALALYDAAGRTFLGMGDEENLANVHVRKAGILRVLGHDDAALGETVLARRYTQKLVEIRFHHSLAGETAAAVLALGFPSTALEYQTAFIDRLQNQLANASDREKQGLRVNRAIALRARAAIQLYLGDYSTARIELDEAFSISKQQADEKIGNALRSRIAEVAGLAALPDDPVVAINHFSEALALAGPIRYRTFQTILLTRRAEAYRRAGRNAEAKQDLEDAIAELNREEQELLRGRRRGEGEGLWSDYFSRFQESYQLLIEQLMKEKRKAEAFAYAEKSRAFEPLKLVLELPVMPQALRALDTRSVDPKTLDQIRTHLPLGTFALEYQIGADQTFVWIVSRDDFETVVLPVGRNAVTEWVTSLQQKAAARDVVGFEDLLDEPFALLRAPLRAIEKLKHARSEQRRLVIVPDRFMHGLPFAALYDRERREHLIEKFPVSIAASASLYAIALDRDLQLAGGVTKPRALFVGDPAFDSNTELAWNLGRLPQAAVEAREAGAFYHPDVKILVGRDATVPAFLALSPDSDIVHVAGHAISNPRAPFGTLLLMAPSEKHTGLLYAEDLLTKLELHRTRLMVLSACSSAGGMPVGPEGLAPLARPIVAAGVPGVMGSLWAINDATSKRVMVEFHQNYRSGLDAASALQQAQLHFLRQENATFPVLAWAPFQVVGFASSPFPRSVHDRGRTSP